MKKLLVLKWLFISLSLNAQTSNNNCFNKYTELNGAQHCLSFASKSVNHLFEAMPKIWLYKYTGTKFTTKPYSELLNTKKLFVFYPTYVNSLQEHQMEVFINTGSDKLMNVTLIDLNVSDEYNTRKFQEIQKESDALADKMGYPKTKLEYKALKPKIWLNRHF